MDLKTINESLFIIGAGAHVPYGMPSGRGLRAEIKKLYAYTQRISQSLPPTDDTGRTKWKILNTALHLNLIGRAETIVGKVSYPQGATEDHYRMWLDEFLKSFSESHVLSIDSYLSSLTKEEDAFKRELFKQFGKLTIAVIITQFETTIPLGVREDNWIHTFINQHIKDNPERFFARPPSIVTFNYDRILERMLYTHLTEQHKYPSQKAKAMIEGLEICHVYGCVGDYTEWRENETNTTFLDQAASNIKVVGEDRNDSIMEVQNKIREKYERSSNIYFLGYGFDSTNNKLLANSFSQYDWHTYKRVYSTSIGIKPSDLNSIKSSLRYSQMFRHNDRNIEQHDCEALLTEVAPLQL